MKPAIIETVLAQLIDEGRELIRSIALSERDLAMRRMMAGRFLLQARDRMPKRGSRQDGWTAFLEALELDAETARRYMVLAESTLNLTVRDSAKIPSYEALGLLRRDGAEGEGNPSTPAPALHASQQQPEQAKANRDAWCTPAPIADALPKKLGTDPCSNAHSIVRAIVKYMLENGQNGLALPWIDLTFVNGPYSNLLPFAEKLEAEKLDPESQMTGAGFLVNADNSPAWWHLLTKHLKLRLDFNVRQEFIPPPGVEPSKNDRPQTLLMDEAFWAACDQRALLSMGTLWIQLAA